MAGGTGGVHHPLFGEQVGLDAAGDAAAPLLPQAPVAHLRIGFEVAGNAAQLAFDQVQ